MQVPTLCKALSDAPNGGQILLEESTMSAIKGNLPELSALVAKKGPGFGHLSTAAPPRPTR